MNEIPENAVAVVTGASSGFGEAIARQLVRENRRVIAVARREDRLSLLQKELGDDMLYPVVVDVRDQVTTQREIRNALAEFGHAGILVNNAGLSKGFGPVQDADVAHWREMVDTNVMGVLHCTEAVLPMMLESGYGHIVNIGSIAASYPYVGGNVYSATKAFVQNLSLNLRADLRGTGIRVTCIEPGMAQTEFALVRFDGDTERASSLYAGLTPLHPEDVANAVTWCLAQPPHVNVNIIEIMPTEQAFELGFGAGKAAGQS